MSGSEAAGAAEGMATQGESLRSPVAFSRVGDLIGVDPAPAPAGGSGAGMDTPGRSEDSDGSRLAPPTVDDRLLTKV